jgi:hypothetical protein
LSCNVIIGSSFIIPGVQVFSGFKRGIHCEGLEEAGCEVMERGGQDVFQSKMEMGPI